MKISTADSMFIYLLFIKPKFLRNLLPDQIFKTLLRFSEMPQTCERLGLEMLKGHTIIRNLTLPVQNQIHIIHLIVFACMSQPSKESINFSGLRVCWIAALISNFVKPLIATTQCCRLIKVGYARVGL